MENNEPKKPNKFDLLESLAKREFNVMDTLRLLQFKPVWLGSWGFRLPKNYKNKILIFRVSGHHHKGYVAISLNWDDTYIVNLISTRWVVKENGTFNNVYCDELLDLLDINIERKKEYVKEKNAGKSIFGLASLN